ncbi:MULTISPECIES: dethiobiotin synthase [unclassified Fibrobacter]|uniref:dethiobiotin synthase n=1 Tax=unclassified Fibrobacter TaxID=2634177 RepID=UPI000D6C3E56|nr:MULTISPECIES: dethiobiotin synthase [unclassified Fibrobacter]PWJ58591.1 dethiobiotin synthetase [Fibrobacter sp. UWR4]PZW62814.1 dethiobiotin synthetase [Fibrobacter sp. UWR1]
MNNGYFVTATGTDVGKTFVTALLVKKWRDSGIDAGYYKAALSGAELRDGKWIAGDADYVKHVASLPDSQEELVSYVYKEAVSPHLAARKEGNPVELAQVKADFIAATQRHEFVFVEGSGGIICPIRYDDKKIFLADIMKELNLPLLIVTTAALGSINSCVLTVEYARARGLDIRGIIVNRYGISGNQQMEDDNIFMMQELTDLPILTKIKEGASDLGAAPF